MKSSNTILVGLTGNICSGKTTVLNFLKKLDAYTLSADILVSELYRTEKVTSWLKENFGTSLKQDIAKKVFLNPSLRKKLEDFLHPKVWQLAMEKIKKDKPRLVFFEIPLLFESSWLSKVDFSLLVVASKDNLDLRLNDRNLSEDEYTKRLGTQISDEQKILQSDFVIHNNSSLQELEQKTKNIFLALKSLSQFN